ncbi:hypothetical protein ETD86_19585 [Nonomuraea turkmeniaca]|uniref:Ricin B lectin domain-containing protein n=1 Tax=Nonomuraea turkmeniaca TaxID=103838 RepID=A0A5S4FI84_9ACTN|nr:RICIN domain-containing protein [Nonomuraea turkmeniaca]TMR19946.1 hypothetical protein ETD86_19585 [Nonomuraea turkmeniaca]
MLRREVIIVLGLLAALAPAVPAAAAEPPVTLVGQASLRCLTVQSASTERGAKAIVWDCNGKPNQEWTYTDAQELRVYSGSDVKCLDVQGRGTAPGTAVQTWNCTGATNQKWTLNANGTISSHHSGLCLDVTGGGVSPNGTEVKIQTCTTGANQKWARPLADLPAGVYFQDTGTLTGWNGFPQKPQKQGVLRTVGSPVYKGSTAIEARQTYVNEGGGYHSETIQHRTQAVGQDRYYGQAIYLPPTWQFHNQNVTFQQWSPEDPEGPWELMFVQNDELRLGGSGGFSATLGKITNLRGTWIRIVTRLKFHATDGAFEVWVNGQKTWSRTGVTVLPKTSQTIRWSSGIYCTGWREGTPSGQSVLSIYHDHARIASSYALAEPANW